jgi:glutamyl-tRNA reductase
MNSTIHLIGLNHRTAAVEVREQFALTNFCSPETWAIPCGNGIHESLILSTCNRVEVLLVGEGDAPRKQALECWAHARGKQVKDLEPYLYQYKNEEAIRHLFSVASSLDSLVLGEPQILGQLKNAYRKATLSHSAGTIINRLLHKAFSVAKRVRSETGVASSAVSISYAAVELAKRIFDDMEQHDALIIGAGEMAELAAMHLKQAGVRRIRVANRTFSKAEELASGLGGEAIPFDKLFDHLADTDIVISSTGAPDAILHEQDMRSVLKKRRNRPMFLIDIAMPRDIDPSVNTLDNIYLYDIDDLKEVVEENIAGRREEAIKARAIVNEETQAFHVWLKSLTLQPTIVALVERGQHIMEEELAKTLHRLGPVDDATKEALTIMADSLVRRFNHEPISFLKDRFHEAANPEYTLQAVDTIKRVFKLN